MHAESSPAPHDDPRADHSGPRPVHLDLDRERGLEITWDDGRTSFFPLAHLRRASPSADASAMVLVAYGPKNSLAHVRNKLGKKWLKLAQTNTRAIQPAWACRRAVAEAVGAQPHALV